LALPLDELEDEDRGEDGGGSLWSAVQSRNAKRESTTDLVRRRLLRDQRGRCTVCGGLLLPDDQQPLSPQDWEHRLEAARKQIVKTIRFATNSPPHAPDLHLIHNTCQTRTDQQPT
jgi:RNA-directed DNA polymerase